MADATTPVSAPARRPPGLPQTSIEDVPFPIMSRIIQRAREGTRGTRFLTYATVSRNWLDASLDSVRAAFLRGEDIDAVMAGGLDRFRELTTVCLKGFQGPELPAELVLRLPRVEALQLKDCPNLRALPDSIGGMVSLKKLSLHGLEQLASLPPSLLRATTLETVAIWKCHRIEESPEETFAALAGVKHLNLHVFTSHILDSIQGLPHLETLLITIDEVHPDRQTTLPGFHSLSSLKRVSIRRAPSDDMPPDGAISLWEPLIDSIEVSLSPTMSIMHQLQHLDLRGALTECIPELLGRLPFLQSLFLQCSCITSLPPGFPSLQHLTLKVHDDPDTMEIYFWMFPNRNMPHDYGPLSLASYPSLKHLTIFGKFKVLPPVISDLTTLETLVISAPVEELPGTMRRLGRLRKLELVNCRRLKELPEEITSIKTLEALTCSSKECEIPLSPAWDLKLLDLSRALVPQIKCPGGSVGVKELRLSCDYESNTELIRMHSSKLFRGVQVLKVTHRGGRGSCDHRHWDEFEEYTGWLSRFLTCMTDLQVLDLSEAPCVHDLSKCSALVSLRELKLSPDWPQGLVDRRFETVCEFLGLEDLPILENEDKANLRARCREILQADILRYQDLAAEVHETIFQHEQELASLQE